MGYQFIHPVKLRRDSSSAFSGIGLQMWRTHVTNVGRIRGKFGGRYYTSGKFVLRICVGHFVPILFFLPPPEQTSNKI